MPPSLPVTRFRADLAALCPLAGSLGLAVSGGPDSLALLLLACSAFPGTVYAATVDHGLRPESANEADQVGSICATLAVPHTTLAVCVASGGEGRQGEARRARYEALAAWVEEKSLTAVLTAHHQDDQAETLVMRLLRGSGVAGLAGIRARALLPGSAIPLLRPLLGWRREELAAIVAMSGLSAVDDPSNRDESHDRPRIRRLLSETLWLDVTALARSASALGDAEEALSWAIERLAQERIRPHKAGYHLDVKDMPTEFRRRLVVRILQSLKPEAIPRGTQVTDFLASLERGDTSTLAGVKGRGGQIWSFERAPSRKS